MVVKWELSVERAGHALVLLLSRARDIFSDVSSCEVPGVPVIGNLLQLKEKRPHKTFTKWAEAYGPVYSIRIGATDVAKEAMVTRFSSISTRKLSNALKIISSDKNMVSDYDDFHKMVKRNLLINILGPNAQKRHRDHRDTLVENMSNGLHACLKNNPLEAVNFRHFFGSQLFGLALKQVSHFTMTIPGNKFSSNLSTKGLTTKKLKQS